MKTAPHQHTVEVLPRNHTVSSGVCHFANVLFIPLDGGLRGLKDCFDGVCNFRPDAISREQCACDSLTTVESAACRQAWLCSGPECAAGIQQPRTSLKSPTHPEKMALPQLQANVTSLS